MAKFSKKKQAAAQGNRPTSRQADKRIDEQAIKLTSWQANRLAKKQSGKRSKPVFHLLLIVIVGFLVYSNTFHSPFQWDEADYLVTNPFIRNLDYFAHPSKAELFLDNAIVSRYVGYLSFALNYQVNGLNVVGYHVVNLAIHLVNAVLVYLLALFTFRTPYFGNQLSAISYQRTNDSNQRSAVSGQQLTVSSKKSEVSNNTPLNPPLPRGEVKGGAVDYSLFTIHDSRVVNDSLFTIHDSRVVNDSPFTIHYSQIMALAVALLFVSHPVQTEAVTYVFQRFTSLVGMFYMLSLVLYIKGRLSGEQTNKTASYQADKLSSGQTGKPTGEETNKPASLQTGMLTGIKDTPLSPPLPRGEVKGGAIHVSRFTIIWYVLSLLSAILAMKTKENAFTLPVTITLYEFLFFSGPLKSRMLRLAPFLLTLLIIPATLSGMSNTAAEVISQVKDPLAIGYEQLSRTDYLFTQFRVIVTYLRLLLLPLNQNIDYTYPLSHSFVEPRVLFSFLFLLSLFGTAVYLIYRSRQADRLSSGQSGKPTSLQTIESASRQADSDTPPNPLPGKGEATSLCPPLPRGEVKGGVFHDSQSAIHDSRVVDYSLFTMHYARLVAFGIIWFFITLSVESSVIPIPMVITEYRMYLPSVGFFLAVAAGVMLLFQQFKSSSLFTIHYSLFTKIAAALFAIIVLVLASATYARNTLWKDKVSLWEDVVRKSPDSPRAYNNLGIAYYENKQYEKAIEMYEQVLGLLPMYRNARVNLGVAYATTGRIDEAIEEFRQGIALDPKNSVAFANLGRAYTSIGRYDEAAENYIRATKLDNYNSTAYHGLGFAYVQLDRLDDALAAYTKFIELSPKDPEAYRNRGNVYGYKGDFISAGADFRKACSLGSQESCNYLQDPRFQ